MKKIGAKVLLVFSLLIIFLGVGSQEVSAKDLYEVHVEYRLYSDLDDVERKTPKGGYVSAYSSFTVESGEIWSGDNYVSNKLQKMGEEALQKQFGKTASVAGMVETYERFTGYRSVRSNSNTVVRNGWDQSKMQLKFPSHHTFQHTLTVTLFGSLNGPLNGWKVHGNAEKLVERYYNNNIFLTGINKVGQTTYLFNSSGAKQYGWHNVNGWQMYFNPENGGLWTGKRKIGETTYLFNSQGHKIDGWHRLNGKDYFFNRTNGGMWTGKRKIGQTTYLLHNDGHKIFGWHVDKSGNKYYFDPNFGGGMVTSFRKVGNAHYYFDTTTGAALKNQSRTINGERWYFNNSGVGTRR